MRHDEAVRLLQQVPVGTPVVIVVYREDVYYAQPSPPPSHSNNNNKRPASPPPSQRSPLSYDSTIDSVEVRVKHGLRHFCSNT